MAGGLKLFDYRMTEKEHILAETIIEMTDKSELFRTGLEHFDWSEMQLIFSLILIKIKRPITHLDHLRPIIKNQCCSCMTKTQQKI